MKNPVKISMFALLFAIIALPVIAQQGGGAAAPARVAIPVQINPSPKLVKSNIKITPDFEKKLWCEIVHKNYSFGNEELNLANDAARDEVVNKLYLLGFRLKSLSTTSSAFGESHQIAHFSTYFFERARTP